MKKSPFQYRRRKLSLYKNLILKRCRSLKSIAPTLNNLKFQCKLIADPIVNVSDIDLKLSMSKECGPNQPILAKYPLSKAGKQNRAFSVTAYKLFPFVEYSVTADAVFCFPCRMFPSKSGNAESTFTMKGFRIWKKLHSNLKTHEKTESHTESMSYWLNWQNTEKSGTILHKIDNHADINIASNRYVLSSLARIATVCARQGLALRGHRESSAQEKEDVTNKGNFLSLVEMLKLESEAFNLKLSSLPKNANYLSKLSQNELLEAASNVVQRKICSEVRDAPCFAIIADEARDISRTEQLSICIRYAKEGYIHERFLQFIDTHEFDAQALSNEISTCLNEKNFDLTRCIAQCYDGASVMSGKHAGVQELFRVECKSPCLYVHCHAHRLNLVLVDTCKDITRVSDTIGLMEAIYSFLTASVRRHDIYKQFQTSAGLQVLELPQQSDTRWVCKHRAVKVFISRYGCIVATLQELSKIGIPKERAEAKGLMKQLTSFTFLFILNLLDLILPLINILSERLQSKTTDSSSVMALVASTKATLLEKRSSSQFQILLDKVRFLAIQHGLMDPTQPKPKGPSNTVCDVRQPRHSRTPAHLVDSIIMSTTGSRAMSGLKNNRKSSSELLIVKKLRRDMFEVIDRMNGEMAKRFSLKFAATKHLMHFQPSIQRSY